jgi:predicted dehydrogenase
MDRVIRWGVLGASNFAATMMGPAIHEAQGAELVALGTSSPAKAEQFRAFCPRIRTETYDGLLAAGDIDAVYIPLPNHLHVEWATRALEAGKHVLVEKPIAMHADEIDGLIALRDSRGLLAAEAYMIVHHPQWIKARELLRSGAVGKLKHVDVSFTYNNPDMANIRNRPETGGGSIRDIGVYAYGSVRYATGEEPRSLTARIVWQNEVDVVAHVHGQFESFSYTAMTSTRMAPRQEVAFHGDQAVLRVTAPYNAAVFGEEKLVLERADKTIEQFRYPGTRQYKLQVENFGHTVRDGRPYPWTLEDAQGTQRMMDRVFAAAG